jgi:hypothetical protein
MELLDKFVGWAKKLTEAFVAMLALAVVLQVLLGSAQPFFPVDVVGNIVDLTKQLGSEGLVGLVAAWILITILNKK